MKKIVIVGLLISLSGCTFSRDEVKNVMNKVKNFKVEQSQDEKETTSKEEDFNNSGQAKEILSEQDLWAIYENKDANFSLRYPRNVVIGKNRNSDQIQLSVSVAPIDKIENPSISTEDFQNIAKKLEKGEYGEDMGESLENSKKIRELQAKNAQEGMVLSRFEVCDVVFERNLVFYTGEYQVFVSVIGPKEKIIEENPDFFKKDIENCSSEDVWVFERQSQFYSDLSDKKGAEISQEWFDAFDEIVNTIDIGNLVAAGYTNRVEIGQEDLSIDESEIVLMWPKISGINNTEVYEKIVNILDFEKVVGKSVEKIEKEYGDCKCGVVGTVYSVNYNTNGLLSISLSIDTLEAYSENTTKNFVINLNSGDALVIEDIVDSKKIKELVSLCDGKLQKNISDTKEALIKSGIDIPLEYYKGKFKEDNLKNYVLTDKGIGFTYDYEFPQVIKSAEPSPYIFVSYSEIKELLLSEGIIKEVIK